MFAFSQIDPETTGYIPAMPIPITDYLSKSAEEAWGGTLGKIYNYRQFLEEEADKDSPLLSPEEANTNYPAEKPWSEPVHENLAQFMNDRFIKNQQTAFFLQNDTKSIVRNMAGMGVGMVSSMLNPVDLALLFVPVVGEASVVGPIEEQLLYKGALGRGAILREKISEGLVTNYRLEQMFGKHADIVESAIQGGAYMTMVEPINQFVGRKLNEEPGNPLLNIAEGTVMAAGMHAVISRLGRLFASLSHETKKTAFIKSIDDFVKDKDIDVSSVVKIDNKYIEDQVALKEELANLQFNKDNGAANPEHVKIAEELGLRYDGIQALIPGQFKAVYTSLDKKNPYTVYADVGAIRAEVKALFKAKVDANKPEPTFEEKIQQIFKTRLDTFRKEVVPEKEKPSIPETGVTPEQQAYSSVLDEIRKKGLRTNEAIQQNFPLAELSREQAAVLRRSAWNETTKQLQKEQNLVDIINKAKEQFKSGPSAKRLAREEAFRNMPILYGIAPIKKLPVVFSPEDAVIAIIVKEFESARDRVVKSIKERFITQDSWEQFHPDVQAVMADVISLLQEHFPALKGDTWSLNLKAVSGAIAHVFPFKKPLLEFNTEYYLKDSYQRLLDSIAQSQGKPGTFRHHAGSGLASTIFHEVGHVIADLYNKKVQRDVFNSPQIIEFEKLFSNKQIQAAYDYVAKHPPTQSDLSGYGSRGSKNKPGEAKHHEPFAEAFAEAYSGIHPPTEWQKGFNKALGVENIHSAVAKMRAIGFEPQKGKLGTQGFFVGKSEDFVGLSVKVSDEGIHLNNIQVKEELRNKGIDTAMIKKLQGVADTLHKPLTLTAEALAKHEPGKQARLESYYERLGFKRIKDNEFIYEPNVPVDKPPTIGINKPNEPVVPNTDKKWRDVELAWQKYVTSKTLGHTDFNKMVQDILIQVKQGKAPEELGYAAAIFNKQTAEAMGNESKLMNARVTFRKELNKYLYTDSPPMVHDVVVEQLKRQGEMKIKALEDQVKALNPNPELIKSATDCILRATA